MNIRKLIKEQLERIFNEEIPGAQPAIQGMEILNHFPFNKLPETRATVNWSQRGVSGWGDVFLPAIDGNGTSQITSKEDIIGNQPFTHPKTGHVSQSAGYITDFKNRFGEEPMFKIDSSAPWYGRVQVVNEPYLANKQQHDQAVTAYGTSGD